VSPSRSVIAFSMRFSMVFAAPVAFFFVVAALR